MAEVFLLEDGSLMIKTSIPKQKLEKDPHIIKYYNEVIESIDETGIRMKPGVTSTKNMRKRTIAQWLILDIVEKEVR